VAFKAKAVSELILPVQIAAGTSTFTVELRRITPKQYAALSEQASELKANPETGKVEKGVNNQKFADLLFAAAVVKATGLTPAVVAEMVELENDSDQPTVDENGEITDRAFLKFLWDDVPGFAVQVMRANDRMLSMAKVARDIDQGNSASSSAA